MGASLILLGVACIIGGIIGGGLKLRYVEFPTIASIRRQIMLGGFGIVLAIAGAWMHREQGSSTTAQKAPDSPALGNGFGSTAPLATTQNTVSDNIHANLPPQREILLDCARREVGTDEAGGENRGPRVDEYSRSLGFPPGRPWSAIFVSFCVKSAGLADDLPASPTDDGLVQRARVRNFVRNLEGQYTPQPGDIVAIARADSGEFFHSGIVERYLPERRAIQVIEGNTNDHGGRNGTGVFRRVRNITTGMVFIRIEPRPTSR